MRPQFILGVLLLSTHLTAQYSLRILVDVPEETERVFISGNFNGWTTGDFKYKLICLGRNRYQINLSNLAPAEYRFKFNQGNWERAEHDGKGNATANRFIKLVSDTIIYEKVLGWTLPFFDSANSPNHTVTFVVSGPVSDRPLFIAGNFNSWKPGEERYKLIPLNYGLQKLTVAHLTNSVLEYKFTRGTWSTVESTAEGLSIDNRSVKINSDTILFSRVGGWMDEYVDPKDFPQETVIKLFVSKANYWLYRNADSAIKYADAAYRLTEKSGAIPTIRSTLDILAKAYAEQGNNYKAVEIFYRQTEIAKKEKDSIALTVNYNHIGNAFLQQGDTSKAKESYIHAISLFPKTMIRSAQRVNLIHPLTSLGRIYLNKKMLDSAEHFIWAAVDLGVADPNWALLLLGDTDKEKGDFKTALQQYKYAITGALATDGSSPFLAEAYYKVAHLFYINNQTDSSFYYARKAYGVAKEIKNPYQLVLNGNLLIDLFKREHRPDSAFFYQEQVIVAKDSVFNKEKERQLQAAYYNEKLRQQELAGQNEKLQEQIKFYLLLGGLALLMVGGLQYRARLKTSFYKKTAEMEMKALRAQMNPHFIFNCLTSINRYIVKSDNKTASNYLTKFSKLIRLILDNSAEEYISLDTEQQTLKLYMDMETLRFDHAFEYEIINDDTIANETISIPPMLIQPYVENAIWHGLLHKEEKGKLWIRFKRKEDNLLSVEVEDNGVGRKMAWELRKNDELKKKSYGMKISRDRLSIFNRLFKYKPSIKILDLEDSDGHATGTKVVLEIPLLTSHYQITKSSIA